jgi:3-deoxy-D-manno-octulosonate 8-phosphate phosphatase (KDO 8-P phosphatase)
MKNYKELLKNISTFIFDYDGVLSDGTVTVFANGEHVRTGYVKDGYAIHLAIKKNFRVAVISGGTSESMELRCKVLGIPDIFLGVQDKKVVFNKYILDRAIDPATILYVGDDIPDFPVMKLVGLAVCPQDACEEIKAISHYISPYNGGKGCVRDIIEQVLKVHGVWMDKDAFIW